MSSHIPSRQHSSALRPRVRLLAEALEDRRCPTTIHFSGGALSIVGDNGPNQVSIMEDDSANRLQVSCDAPGGGRTTQTFSSSQVQAITVSLKGGNDVCRYSLLSDLSFAKTVRINMGAGNDLADVGLNQGAPHAMHANFSLNLLGGAGADRLMFDSRFLVDTPVGFPLAIDRGTMTQVHLDGGPGRDAVSARYQGLLAGFLDLQVTGGASRDGVSGSVDLLPGSTGTVRSRIEGASGQGLTPLVPDIESGQVLVNGVPLSAAGLQILHQFSVFPLPGSYWYDSRSGAAGIVGQGTSGFLPAGLPLGGALAADASNGTSGVFVNGRQLTTGETDFLGTVLGSPIAPGRYFLDANGDAGMEGGPVLVNLIQLARQRGVGNHSVLSTYDVTGIGVLGDGNFIGILNQDGPSVTFD